MNLPGALPSSWVFLRSFSKYSTLLCNCFACGFSLFGLKIWKDIVLQIINEEWKSSKSLTFLTRLKLESDCIGSQLPIPYSYTAIKSWESSTEVHSQSQLRMGFTGIDNRKLKYNIFNKTHKALKYKLQYMHSNYCIYFLRSWASFGIASTRGCSSSMQPNVVLTETETPDIRNEGPLLRCCWFCSKLSWN